MDTSVEKSAKKSKIKITSIIGIILCVILLPILILNITLIIRGYTDKDNIPSLGGVFPLIVLTDSMNPEIQGGDLIFCKQVDTNSIAVGDIIAFFDPASSGSAVLTHRVTEITEKDGKLAFKTKGDANNTEDELPVLAEKVVGTYSFRIPQVGRVAMFMQTTLGLIVCVILPMTLLIGYEVIRTKKFNKKSKDDNAALVAELNALRAEVQKQQTNDDIVSEKPDEPKSDSSEET